MEVRIVHLGAAPVQSGPARDHGWVVEFEPEAPPGHDPLMGWTSSTDPRQQVRLTFPSLAAAEAYCRREGLDWVVHLPHRRGGRRRSYADNFLPLDGRPKPIYPH